jgi:hypothetical protein
MLGARCEAKVLVPKVSVADFVVVTVLLSVLYTQHSPFFLSGATVHRAPFLLEDSELRRASERYLQNQSSRVCKKRDFQSAKHHVVHLFRTKCEALQTVVEWA